MLNGVYPIFQHWAEQTVWIYSDPHFGDKDLEIGVKDRPSDIEQFKALNSCIGRKDTIIFLGDIGDLEYIRKLKGHKVLIMGNHDAGRTNYERKIEVMKFDSDVYTREQALKAMKEKYPNCQYKIEKQYSLSRPPFEYWKVWADNKLFDEIYEGALIIGEKIILSHEPVSVPWAFNIHGHDHAGAKRANHLNVCSDVIGYKPVNLNQFLKSGALSKIQTIHRETIDNATKRKQKRGGKKIGKR